MLSELCAELKNYFIVDQERDLHFGSFLIADGSIELSFLQEGQYFRIVGSVFNDGVYQYPASDLTDETFDGAVWAMSVPAGALALADKIGKWITDNAEAINKPYQSESFAGYSYSKGSGNSGGSGSGSSTDWQTHFSAELKPYRRVSIL